MNVETVNPIIEAAADYALRLAQDGKSWEEAYAHAFQRYGVIDSVVNAELARRKGLSGEKPKIGHASTPSSAISPVGGAF